MASTNTTSSSPPIRTAKPANEWSDFINTVGTAIGPILTLFGEQATKQFLSLSMGWADNVLLATGPIGIITVVVSTIRIGGYRWMKGVVGRARESRTAAELEFLSSTSKETCELWSGREIVRVSGKPSEHGLKTLVVKQWEVLTDPVTEQRSSCYDGLLGLHEACQSGLLSLAPEKTTPRKCEADEEKSLRETAATEIEELALEVPNLTLNLRGTILKASELRFWVLLGILLQSFALLFPALATYYPPWKWPRKGAVVPEYAYACFATGSAAIIIGLLGCGRVVEASTIEYTFEPTPGVQELGHKASVQAILRLQVACTVGSQLFGSYAILNSPNDMVVRTSHLSNDERFKPLTALSVVLALSGFLVQFVGLSALHWSATVVVIVTSIFMTIIRAVVRRGLGTDPRCVKMPENIELVWVALRVIRGDWDEFLPNSTRPIASSHRLSGWTNSFRANLTSTKSKPQVDPNSPCLRRDCEWGVLTGFIEPRLRQERQWRSIWDSELDDSLPPAEKRLFNDGTHYVQQLKHLHHLEFGLGFGNAHRQCLMQRAIEDIVSTTPNMPLGEFHELADITATAMEGIMRCIHGVNQNQICWQISKKPSDEWQLIIDVQTSFGVVSSWFIRGGGTRTASPARHGSLRADLNAGLSLWMYSLACTSQALNQLYSHKMFKSHNNGLKWGFGKVPTGTRGHFPRIVGGSGFKTHSEIIAWIPHTETHLVRAYDGTWLYGQEIQALSRSVAMGWTAWPVFGLYYSSSFSMYVPPRNGPTFDSRTRFKFEPHAGEFDETRGKLDCIVKYGPSWDSVEYECAREVLSLFMLSMSMGVWCVGSKTRQVTSPNGIISLTNSLFSALAETVVDAGLVGDPSHALMYVIPAFAKFNLLPWFDDDENLVTPTRMEIGSTGNFEIGSIKTPARKWEENGFTYLESEPSIQEQLLASYEATTPKFYV